MEELKREYYKKVHFWGRITIASGVLASFLFPAYLTFIKGWNPGWAVVGAALLIVGASVSHNWWNIAIVITRLLILGPSGSYMGYLSGNIDNMRMPAALAAQSAVGAEQGSIKSEMVGTIAVVASIIVNTSFLVVLVLIGSALVTKMPASVKASFAYVTPAIFGGVFAQLATMAFPNAIAALVISVGVVLYFGLPSYLQTPCTVLLTILVGLYMLKRKNEHTVDKVTPSA